MWHSPFARKVLGVYPCFIFHYTFNRLILEDPECARLWNEAKPFAAGDPHRVQYLAEAADGIERATAVIDSGCSPVHKLAWRVDSSNEYWSAVVAHLAPAA